jgi:hypothetical protein
MDASHMRLEDFDWSRLMHAYGSAEDVPELFEDLLGDDYGRSNEPSKR